MTELDPKLRRKPQHSNDSRSRENIQRSTKRRRTKCPPHVLCRRRAVSRRSGCGHAHARQIQPLPGGNPLFEVVQLPSLGRQRLRGSLPSSDIPGEVRLPIFSPGQGIGTESYRFRESEKSVPDEFKRFRRRWVNLLQQQDCPASPVAALLRLATNRSKAPASIPTSTRKIRLGFVFSRTLACGPCGRIRSARCSMRLRRSRSILSRQDTPTSSRRAW